MICKNKFEIVNIDQFKSTIINSKFKMNILCF